MKIATPYLRRDAHGIMLPPAGFFDKKMANSARDWRIKVISSNYRPSTKNNLTEIKTVSLLPDNAVWKTFHGNGEPAHFYHAAGFPVDVYSPMLSILSRKFKMKRTAILKV